MNLTKKIAAGVATAAMLVSSFASTAFAAPPPFGLEPFEFVGTAEQCGSFGAGTDTVTAKWDNTTGNPAPSIFLEKTGVQENCAAAGVDIITPLEGGPVSALTELNFEFEGYCGGGAPRFNIVSGDNVAFLGCNGGTQTPAGNGYTHVVFNATQIQTALVAAGIDPTDKLDDLYIIFDEIGSTNIDNISVNEQVVGSPTSPQSKDQCKNGGYKDLVGANGQAFKNQGDCVSYFSTGGKNAPSGAQAQP